MKLLIDLTYMPDLTIDEKLEYVPPKGCKFRETLIQLTEKGLYYSMMIWNGLDY